MITDQRVWSVREVRREIEQMGRADTLEDWTKQNSSFFRVPTSEEARFITSIYSVEHFQQNLGRKKLLGGGAFADPFLVASGRLSAATVVTQETSRKNGVGIPNICAYFGIQCTDLQGFLIEQDWKF